MLYSKSVLVLCQVQFQQDSKQTAYLQAELHEALRHDCQFQLDTASSSSWRDLTANC